MTEKKQYQIVLIRHGESAWNLENRFTGWTDVPLTETGIKEARAAGKILKEKGYTFDKCYTSYLKRAVHTLDLVLDEMNLSWLPVEKRWRLNERMYGGLSGLNKDECRKIHGEDKVLLWRRSVDVAPPLLELTSPYHPLNDVRYAKVPKDCLPSTENLIDCIARVLPSWFDDICPDILDGKKLVIAIHGNSIRALVKHLEKLTNEATQGRQEKSVKEQALASRSVKTTNSLMEKLFQNLKDLNEEASGSQQLPSKEDDSEEQENLHSLPVPQFGAVLARNPTHTRSFGQNLSLNQPNTSQRSGQMQSTLRGNSQQHPNRQGRSHQGQSELEINPKNKGTSLHERPTIVERGAGGNISTSRLALSQQNKNSVFYTSENDSSLEQFTRLEEMAEAHLGSIRPSTSERHALPRMSVNERQVIGHGVLSTSERTGGARTSGGDRPGGVRTSTDAISDSRVPRGVAEDDEEHDEEESGDRLRLTIFGQRLPDSSYEGEDEDRLGQVDEEDDYGEHNEVVEAYVKHNRHDQDDDEESYQPSISMQNYESQAEKPSKIKASQMPSAASKMSKSTHQKKGKDGSAIRDDSCSGVFISSEDKRTLLQRLKENFENNNAFDCVEFAIDRSRVMEEPDDSLDIDDRRVLFESEVRKQIHRNAPFEETEDYNKLELIHQLSKNSRISPVSSTTKSVSQVAPRSQNVKKAQQLSCIEHNAASVDSYGSLGGLINMTEMPGGSESGRHFADPPPTNRFGEALEAGNQASDHSPASKKSIQKSLKRSIDKSGLDQSHDRSNRSIVKASEVGDMSRSANRSQNTSMRCVGDQQLEAIKNMFFDSGEGLAAISLSKPSMQKQSSKISTSHHAFKDSQNRQTFKESETRLSSKEMLKKKSSDCQVDVPNILETSDCRDELQPSNTRRQSFAQDSELQDSCRGSLTALVTHNLSMNKSIKSFNQHNQSQDLDLREVEENSFHINPAKASATPSAHHKESNIRRPKGQIVIEYSHIEHDQFDSEEIEWEPEPKSKVLSKQATPAHVPARPIFNPNTSYNNDSKNSDQTLALAELTEYYLEGNKRKDLERESEMFIFDDEDEEICYNGTPSRDSRSQGIHSTIQLGTGSKATPTRMSRNGASGLKSSKAKMRDPFDRDLSPMHQPSQSGFFSTEHPNFPFPSTMTAEQNYLLDNLTEVLKSDFKDRTRNELVMMEKDKVELMQRIIESLEQENLQLKQQKNQRVPYAERSSSKEIAGKRNQSENEEMDIIDLKMHSRDALMKKPPKPAIKSLKQLEQPVRQERSRSKTPKPSEQQCYLPPDRHIKSFKDLVEIAPRSSYSQIHLKKKPR